jgi:hypothetical protein
VVDNQLPTISCPTNVTVLCASQVPSPDFAGGSVTDNCPGVTVVWTGDVTNNMTCTSKFTIQRSYRATDTSGNSSTCTQTITVNDITGPVLVGCTNQFVYQQQIVSNATTCISANFNGTPISAGRWIWFNSVFKAQGTNTTYTINVTGQTITGTIGTSNVTISLPDSQITISSAYTNATTTFTGGKWVTTTPPGLGGNTFLSGGAYQLPFSSPGAGNLNWCGNFSVTPGVSVSWQWAAAVYTSFTANYSSVGVKPVDDNKASSYKNSDHAGTPENYKQYVVGGARGGGGSNYTGSYSATKVANASSAKVCSGGVVQYEFPTATDSCSGMASVTCNPLPGIGFPDGSTNITCTAIDDCGNTNTCSFTVMVAPLPTITCPATITTTESPIGSGSAIVNYPAPAVTDSCYTASAPACTPPSGAVFAVGTNTVTCTATDTGGYTNSCSFLVIVQRGSAPAFRILSISRQNNNMNIVWTSPGGSTNALQATNGGINGSYSNNFVDISGPIIIAPNGGATTNYVDVGGATNRPSRFYRVRLVP